MTIRRIACVTAGALLAAQAAFAAVGDSVPYPNQQEYRIESYPSDGRLQPGVWYWRDSRSRAPMASEDVDNPAYNASNIPDNFPWFGNELLGQRPSPTQMRYFAEREAQLAGRTGSRTTICQDQSNRPYTC